VYIPDYELITVVNLQLDLIDPYRIPWKAINDESQYDGLEVDPSFLWRSTLQYRAKIIHFYSLHTFVLSLLTAILSKQCISILPR